VTDDARFADDTVVQVNLRLEALTDGIVVDGRVAVDWVGTCRRCLAATCGTTDSEIHELYQQHVTNPDSFEIVDDQVDLGAMVREVVLLDAPTTPLCRPDCAGLCPICGVDRNAEVCGCAIERSDPRWAALADLTAGLPDVEAGLPHVEGSVSPE
ncbi:MAG: DUF177 domain-containing protein, partial [Ilumatobacteraceae bacterium]